MKAQEQIDFMTSKIEKEGAVFGTPSLMEPFRYNVTATCLKPTKVLVIEADHLEEDDGRGSKDGDGDYEETGLHLFQSA